MKEFVAFDFETANVNRHSICSVGMVFVEDGEIKDTIYQLINPEEEFDGFNVSIHGIEEEDVADAPTFDKFYDEIKVKIDNKLLVAHYLPFDGYALRDNLSRYNITPATHHLMCSYQLSKRLISGQSSYSIASLCQHFGINLENHHHALHDAKACAELFLRLCKDNDLVDFDSIFLKTDIKVGKISPDNFLTSLVRKNGPNSKLSDIVVSLDADKSNPFYGKNIVFTGKLDFLSRKEAAQLVASKGGHPHDGINKQTDFIVIGNFTDVMIKGNKSSKLLKAEKMIEQGKVLEIIGEDEFMKMLIGS